MPLWCQSHLMGRRAKLQGTLRLIPIPTIFSLAADRTLLQFRCHCTDENHLAGNGFSNHYYVADLEETLKVLKLGFKH
jgi:hypothetical protein